MLRNAYRPGQVVNELVLTRSDLSFVAINYNYLGFTDASAINLPAGGGETEIVNYKYTPKLSSSYILCTLSAPYFLTEQVDTQLYFNNTLYSFLRNQNNSAAGSILPIIGRYINTSTSDVNIKITGLDTGGNNSYIILSVRGESSSFVLNIREIAR